MIWLIDWLTEKIQVWYRLFWTENFDVLILKCFKHRIIILLITVSNSYSVWWSVLCEWPVMRKNNDDAKNSQKWCSWKKWSVYFWTITSRETKIMTFELITARILKFENNDDNCMLIASQHINRRLEPQALNVATEGWGFMTRKDLAIDHLT